jgi:hypothetical protein
MSSMSRMSWRMGALLPTSRWFSIRADEGAFSSGEEQMSALSRSARG